MPIATVPHVNYVPDNSDKHLFVQLPIQDL